MAFHKEKIVLNEATVRKKKLIGRYLLLTVRAPTTFAHKSGQYCMMNFVGKTLKPYSIASMPRENGDIDFCIIWPQETKERQAMETLKVGSLARISEAAGNFPHPSIEKDCVFVAGGSGIAPLRALIQDRLHHNCQQKTLLIFGVDDGRYIPYKDEFDRLAETLENFNIVYCVADISTASGGMLKGLPTKALKTCIDLGTQYVLCGPPAFLEASRDILKTNQIQDHDILVDCY